MAIPVAQPPPKPYRLIIAGGRDFRDPEVFQHGLEWFASDAAPPGLADGGDLALHIISGGARGADTLGADYARSSGTPLTVMPADWKNLQAPGAVIKKGGYGPYNANAGFDRNQQMAAAADAVLLYPGGSGTEHMARIAKEQGLDVYDFRDPANPVVVRPLPLDSPPQEPTPAPTPEPTPIEQQVERIAAIDPPAAAGLEPMAPEPAPTDPDRPMAGARWPWILAAAAGLATAGGGAYALSRPPAPETDVQANGW
ncbi:MAG: DUF2493 domain-containing protein [Prochlorococcaceae cyanobacterium]